MARVRYGWIQSENGLWIYRPKGKTGEVRLGCIEFESEQCKYYWLVVDQGSKSALEGSADNLEAAKTAVFEVFQGIDSEPGSA
jgi:hypothetical protein